MAAKEIRFHQEAREKILQGVNTLANAVRVTLGGTDANQLGRVLTDAATR
jgi:chaperonin GroEL